MVLTKAELIAALQKEVGILIHLAQKLDNTSSITVRRQSSEAASNCCDISP